MILLLGAEVNAEIEHASPYGKAAGEKVPGAKRAIGALAYRRYTSRPAAEPGPAPALPPAPPPEPGPGPFRRAVLAVVAGRSISPGKWPGHVRCRAGVTGTGLARANTERSR